MKLDKKCLRYELHRQPFKLFGANFRLYDPNEDLKAYIRLDRHGFADDYRFYTDESMSEETMKLVARHTVGFTQAYDVIAANGSKIGAFKRGGWRLFLRGDWDILNGKERLIGEIADASQWFSTDRRSTVSIFNRNHRPGIDEGRVVATYRHPTTLFGDVLRIDFATDPNGKLDRRLGIAAAVLIAVMRRKDDS